MFRNITFGILLSVLFLCFIPMMATAQTYYPTNHGNIWVLESEDGAEQTTYSVEKSEESFFGKELSLLKIVTKTLGTDSIITDKFFIDFDEDGIKLYRIEADLGRIFGIATAVFYPPVLLYPLQLELGDSWEITAETEVILSGAVTFISTSKVVKIEDVVTPAGTFENCLKIRIDTKSISFLGATRATAYQWFAPNFGPVKFENTQDIVYNLVHSNLLYDVTGDSVVNISDLVFVASRFGQEDAKADVNNDGNIDILDLVLVAKHFGN